MQRKFFLKAKLNLTESQIHGGLQAVGLGGGIYFLLCFLYPSCSRNKIRTKRVLENGDIALSPYRGCRRSACGLPASTGTARRGAGGAPKCITVPSQAEKGGDEGTPGSGVWGLRQVPEKRQKPVDYCSRPPTGARTIGCWWH